MPEVGLVFDQPGDLEPSNWRVLFVQFLKLSHIKAKFIYATFIHEMFAFIKLIFHIPD